MNALPYTLLLLTLMALMSTGHFQRHMIRELVHRSALESCASWRAFVNADEARLYKQWVETNLAPKRVPSTTSTKKERRQTKPKQEVVNSDRDGEGEEELDYPDATLEDFVFSERLHLPALLANDGIRERFSSFLDQVYGREPFFEAIPHASTRLLNQLSKVLESFKAKPGAPENTLDLATLDLEDMTLQKLWYRLLKGSPGHYPSLFDFVKYEPGKDGHMLFRLPEPLMRVLIANRSIAEDLIEHRNKLLLQYFRGERKKTEVVSELDSHRKASPELVAMGRLLACNLRNEAFHHIPVSASAETGFTQVVFR